jgi:hypothetical protein
MVRWHDTTPTGLKKGPALNLPASYPRFAPYPKIRFPHHGIICSVWYWITFEQIVFFCYSPSPATIGITMPLDEKDKTINEEQAKNSISVDSSRPVTTIQIRLADGSRLVGQFNHTHTIADVRRFITVYPLHKSHVIKAVRLWGTNLLGNVEISR